MTRNVAEAIVDALVDAEVGVVFGIPGAHNLGLFAALDTSPIRTVVVRREASAGYAADAVGRLTGRPGVCVTTSGSGAMNAITAMGEAHAARSPLLHIATTAARPDLGADRSRGVLRELPRQREIFGSVTKLARHLEDRDEVSHAVRAAIDMAAEPPQGPVYLEVPTDLLDEEDAPALSNGRVERGPVPTRDELRRLASFLCAAERPAIWVGSGAAGCGEPVTELAARLHAPVVLTHGVKRRWDGSPHPLVLAHPPHEPPVTELLGECDALLVLGSDLDGKMTQESRLRLDSIVRVDVDAERAGGGDPYTSVQGVVGDAWGVLGALLLLVPEQQSGWGGTAVRAASQAAAAGLQADPDAHGGLAFLRGLQRALDDRDAVVVCDMAVSGCWTGGYLPLSPRRRVLHPPSWEAPGFALPASIGAAAASGDRRTVAICGDGGVLSSAGELATLAQERLDVTVVVHNDSGYGMLRHDEERRFGRTFAVDLDGPDFPALACAFGLPAWSTDLDDHNFEDVLRESLDIRGPALVEVGGELSPPRTASARWPLSQSAG